MIVNKCPYCCSKNIIKKGVYKYKNNIKQRYYCKDCLKYFQLKRRKKIKLTLPKWVEPAYNDYVLNNILLKDIRIKYNKSIPTINKYFDILNDRYSDSYDNITLKADFNEITKQSINLIFDGVFFK